MPNLAQSLADVQAEFDKKTQLADELTEKLRLQVADTSELKRQLDKVYEHLTEQTLKATAAESGPVEAADKNTGPTSRRDKLSNDALLDVFTFLNRFNVDAAHIAYRQGRYVVEKMLTTQCLRELTYVTLKRVEKPHVDPEGRRDNWLLIGFRLLPGQISDGFLSAAGDKLALTRLRYDTDRPTDAWTVTFDATERGIMQFLFRPTKEDVWLEISHVNVSKTFCTGFFRKALLEPAANDLCLAMRFDNLKQDLTGVLDWHFPELDYSSWGSCKKEIYSVKARLGKRLRLAIDKKPCGRLSSLEFRRSSAFGREEEAVYNKRSDNDAAPNYL